VKGDPLLSPWDKPFEDYLGRVVSIRVDFNNVTRAITACSVHRDVGCLYSRILIGVGADGSPESTDKAFPIQFGDTNVNINQLKNKGLDTIGDVTALQITAGV
jgi:hypothetical protein